METTAFDLLYQEFITTRQPLLERQKSQDELATHLAALLSHTRSYIWKLRELFLSSDVTPETEIRLFKFYKPRIYRWLIYDAELFAIHRQAPPEGGDKTAAYYEEHLTYYARSLKQHDFLYSYYRLKATELDRLYFLRNSTTEGLLAPIVPDTDPEFATGGDYLFARFMATELIIDALTGNESEPALPAGSKPIQSKKGREIRWTADSCNLVEVIYGLHETKVINDGDVDVQDIIDVFEEVFSISLRRAYRRWTEIKRRKSAPQLRYLADMQTALQKRIDDEDAYIPRAMKS